MTLNKSKILIAIGLIVVVTITIGFSVPFINYIDKPDELRMLIESYKSFAPIMYIFLTMFQVLMPFIPGEPFELLAGYLFGSVEGALICLISSSIASILIILLVRKYGTKLVHVFFKEREHKKLHFLKSKKAFFIYSLLFILPGTPKDLLCYVGGLAKFDLIPLIIVTTLGRIPGIITSTIPADVFGDKNYLSAAIIYGVTIVISLISLYVYKKIVDKNSK